MSYNTKKFLDINGVKHLIGILDDYPNNQILSTVISAIQEELDEKASLQDAVKVTQNVINTNSDIPVILAKSAATTAETDTVNKTSTLKYNPSTRALVTGGSINGYTLASASEKGVTDNTVATEPSASDINLITGRTLYNTTASEADINAIFPGENPYTSWTPPQYSYTETDPTVPAWAKAASKPTYTAQEIGALPASTYIPYKTSDLINDSGYLTAHQDISGKQNLLTFDTVPTINSNNPVTSQGIYNAIANIKTMNIHICTNSQYDSNGIPIIAEPEEKTFYLVPSSDNNSNDMFAEWIYINNNWEKFGNAMIDLSNYALKEEIPTYVSELINDRGYLTTYSESDPTVPSWAKASTKPSYTATEVGALPSNTHIPSTTAELTNDAGFITSADLPTKVSDLTNDAGYLTAHQDISGKANAADLATVATSGSYNDLLNKPSIPSAISDLTDDSGHYTKPAGGIPAADLAETYLTSFTETDPTVPSWAKAATKPSYTAAEVGAPTVQEMNTALSDKQNTLTFDTAPTANSTNPVTSGGLKTVIDAKAAKASPTFTGTPKAPTATKGTNTTQIATTAFVQTAIGDVYKEDNLGTFSSLSDLQTLLNTKIESATSSDVELLIRCQATATFSMFVSSYIYRGVIYNSVTAGSTSYCHVMLYSNASNDIITGLKAAGNWSFSIVQRIYDNAGYHNSIWRGAYLGDEFTSLQSTRITGGAFYNLFLGDYWTINGVNWRIMAFDYFYGSSSPAFNTHHIIVVPDTYLYTCKWNTTNNTVTGGVNSGAGYIDSYIRSNIKSSTNSSTEGAELKVIEAFGDSHVLSFSPVYPSAYDSSGVATGFATYEGRVELMSEMMVYGSHCFSKTGFETGLDRHQLPGFSVNTQFIKTNSYYWLRDVSTNIQACSSGNLCVSSRNANLAFGVRPFAIIA